MSVKAGAIKEEEEEIALDASWLRDMRQKAENARWKATKSKRGSCPTIQKLPDSIRATKPEAYTPKMIFLGPFHQRRPQERDDLIKWPYLDSFLARKPTLLMEDYLKVIKASEQRLRSAYPKPLEIGSNEFAEMMLLDCCFVLEFLLVQQEEAEKRRKIEAQRKADQKQQQQPQPQQQQQQAEEDPFRCIGSLAPPLDRHDILLLENQLPLFLLESLYEKAGHPVKFEDLVFNFFEYFFLFPTTMTASDVLSKMKPSDAASRISKDDPAFHLLHLFHRCISPSSPLTKSPGDEDRPTQLPSIHCARELREAKVKLVKKKKPRVFLDVHFLERRLFWSGWLEIPQVLIDDDTDKLFRNLIAFEQCFPRAGNHVSAYVWFMDSIIDNNGDVALLRQRSIVVKGLGSDEDVANLFNQLCKEVELDVHGSYLVKVMDDVRKYCESPCNKRWASLKHTYFSNPWSVFALIGAISLFLLTLLQTFLATWTFIKERP